MTAYTYGVYDLFHIGHVNLFKRIKQKCSKLIVGVHNDEQVMTYKNKPIINYYDRLEIVKSCRYVDEIYENADLITTDNVLIKLKADFIFAGNENPEYLKKYYQVSSDKLVLLDRTENVSTSKIKNILAL
jgi:glycerol-3-phosphate cytidylyltransferase